MTRGDTQIRTLASVSHQTITLWEQVMKPLLAALSFPLILSLTSPAIAQDSLRASGNASAASATSLAVVSVATASVVVVSAHAGGVMIVESVRAIGNVVEIVLKGAANASRAVITVTTAAASGVAIAAGQSVKVVPEGNGYLLITGTKVLCYVPAESDRQLVRSTRSN